MATFLLSVLALVAGIVLVLWGSLGGGGAFSVTLGTGSIIAAYSLLSVSL